MRQHEMSWTLRVSSILILGLLVAAPALQAEVYNENHCVATADGLPLPDTLYGTLKALLVKTRSSNAGTLAFDTFKDLENWHGSDSPLLKDQTVIVPQHSTASLSIMNREGTGGLNVEKVRFKPKETVKEGEFRPVAPTVWFVNDYRGILTLCIKNSQFYDHTWNFGVLIDGTWYNSTLTTRGPRVGVE